MIAQAGIKFVIFSTLEAMPKDVKAALPEIEPGYTVPHFDAKARVLVHSRSRQPFTLPLSNAPSLHLLNTVSQSDVCPGRLHISRIGSVCSQELMQMSLFRCFQDYLKQSGLPHASLLTSAFFDNFLRGFNLQRQGDAFCWGHNLGTAPHAWHAVGDIGGSAAGMSPARLISCSQYPKIASCTAAAGL